MVGKLVGAAVEAVLGASSSKDPWERLFMSISFGLAGTVAGDVLIDQNIPPTYSVCGTPLILPTQIEKEGVGRARRKHV